MPDKYEPLTLKSLNLLRADYTHAIERVLEANEDFEDYDYAIPREALINEIKRMEVWLSEHDLNGDGAIPHEA